MKAKRITRSVSYVLIIAILLLAASFSITVSAESKDPEQTVRTLQESLLQVMREGDNLSFQERFDFLNPVISQSHDIDFIIHSVLGHSYWSELDSLQKNTITAVFRQLSIATYAGRFNRYGGEQFKIVEHRSLPRDHMLVRSWLITADNRTINFDYILAEKGGYWRIVNIIVDGVSDLALKRVEYRAVLQRDGFSELVEMLREKIELAKESR